MTFAELVAEHDEQARATNKGKVMSNDKSIYYRADGSEVGPLPASGRWPSIYESRGLFLQRPTERRTALCVIEFCEFAEEGNGFVTDSELVAHARDVHGMEVLRNLGTGEIVFEEMVAGEDEAPEGDSSASGANGGAEAERDD